MKRPILKLPHPPPEKPPELLPRSALIVPITIPEADDIVADYIAQQVRLSTLRETWAAEARGRWGDLRGKVLTGDQLWTYKTRPTWVEEGVALERKRRIVAKAVLGNRHVLPYDMFRQEDRIPAPDSPHRTK